MNRDSTQEKEMRYDNILFLLDTIDQTKTKGIILHKEKKLNNFLSQIDMFWENHPNWTIHSNQTKTMRNLMYQLQNRGDEFMNCFPKTIFQNKTFKVQGYSKAGDPQDPKAKDPEAKDSKVPSVS